MNTYRMYCFLVFLFVNSNLLATVSNNALQALS